MPDVDLFASRINNQVDIYVSWKSDPHALFIDAFTVTWAGFTNSYAFPPFCLIPRCLHKVVQEKNTMIMLVPVWPTQLHPTFKFINQEPQGFPFNRECFIQSSSRPSSSSESQVDNMQNIRRHILDCSVLNQLPTSLCAYGDQVRKNSTMFTSASGPSFAFKGKLIQCYPL